MYVWASCWLSALDLFNKYMHFFIQIETFQIENVLVYNSEMVWLEGLRKIIISIIIIAVHI